MSTSTKRAREDDTPDLGEKRSKPESTAPSPTAPQQTASSISAWGCQASIGRRDYMEDAHLVDQQVSTSESTVASFFAVFDGHGGRAVSDYLKQHTRAFVQAAFLAKAECQAAALKEAFVKLDASLPACENQGSTALLVVLNDNSIVCASCGDSRAVLSRRGEAVPLSIDHTPDREDEEARIQEAGGRIINHGGARRVMGVLNMSRAIGDTWLQQYGVTPEPEVKILERQPDDELLILASDGLWDVVTNQEAVCLARRSLQRAISQGADRKDAAKKVARVLLRVASDRGSKDNITVIVVDLHAPSPQPSPTAPSPSASQTCSLPYALAPAMQRRHSDPSMLDRMDCKASKADVSTAWRMPRLLSAERLLLVSAASAPPALLVLAS